MNEENRYEALKDNIGYRKPCTVDELSARLFGHSAWLRRNKKAGKWDHGDPLPQATIERDVRSLLHLHPEDFINVGPDLWRKRSPHACSFCLTEDVPVCCEKTHYICLSCAMLCVEVLREAKAMADQIAKNEAAIMSFKEILGA